MLKKAEHGKTLGLAADYEISQALAKIYLIIGLRSNHYPTSLMDSIIFHYLRNHYANRTIDELILAFEFAIFGKLDIDDWKVYDMFSVEYLVRIMESYRRYKVKLIVENKIKPIDKMLPISKITDEEMKAEVNEWRQKELNIDFIPLYLYDYLVRLELVSKEINQSFLWKACMHRKNELHSRAMNGDRESINDHHAFSEMIENGEIIGREKMIVANIAKRIIVMDYLKNK